MSVMAEWSMYRVTIHRCIVGGYIDVPLGETYRTVKDTTH